MQMALGLPQAGHMTGRQALRQKGPLTASALTTAVKAAPTVLRPCPFKPTNAAPRTHSSTQASATYGTALRTAGTKLKQQQLCSSFTRPISLRRAAPKGRPPHAVPINGAPVVQEDIPIHYINATGLEDPEFEVVVFQRDENSANARYKDVAWKVSSLSKCGALLCSIFHAAC